MSSQTHSVAVALQKAGITIPAVPKPAGAYVGAIRTGNLVVTSGQLPWVDGKLLHVGRIGAEGDRTITMPSPCPALTREQRTTSESDFG